MTTETITSASGRFDPDRLRILSVTGGPPAATDAHRRPCPLCGRSRSLSHMRVVKTGSDTGRHDSRQLLVCLDCIREHASD